MRGRDVDMWVLETHTPRFLILHGSRRKARIDIQMEPIERVRFELALDSS